MVGQLRVHFNFFLDQMVTELIRNAEYREKDLDVTAAILDNTYVH